MLRRQRFYAGPSTVTNARSLQGLMKWLSRADWRDQFAEVYDHHLLPACRRTGLDAEEVMAILGEDWFMTTVWGCAFEDFLTREGADGRNVVDEYLKRRGWKESASARAYMSALRRSVMSLYEVSDIVRDTSFRARDLVRGGDPILISERSATRSLKQWDHIATRVVLIGSQMHISGAVLPYGRDASEKILKSLHNVAKRKEEQKIADLVGCNVDDPAIVNAFSQAELLRAVAPTITTVWLIDTIDRATTPQIGPAPILWTVDVLGSGYSVCRQGVLLFLPFLLILLFGPCGAHPSVPARTFDPPSRAGAVKVAHFARPRGLDLDGPEHGGRME